MIVIRQHLLMSLVASGKDGQHDRTTHQIISGIMEELHRTSTLAWRLLELGPFKGLIAVTRGGLVPAAIVARELEPANRYGLHLILQR